MTVDSSAEAPVPPSLRPGWSTPLGPGKDRPKAASRCVELEGQGCAPRVWMRRSRRTHMSYIDGFVIAVPKQNKQKFIEHAKRADPVFMEPGATGRLES